MPFLSLPDEIISKILTLAAFPVPPLPVLTTTFLPELLKSRGDYRAIRAGEDHHEELHVHVGRLMRVSKAMKVHVEPVFYSHLEITHDAQAEVLCERFAGQPTLAAMVKSVRFGNRQSWDHSPKLDVYGGDNDGPLEDPYLALYKQLLDVQHLAFVDKSQRYELPYDFSTLISGVIAAARPLVGVHSIPVTISTLPDVLRLITTSQSTLQFLSLVESKEKDDPDRPPPSFQPFALPSLLSLSLHSHYKFRDTHTPCLAQVFAEEKAWVWPSLVKFGTAWDSVWDSWTFKAIPGEDQLRVRHYRGLWSFVEAWRAGKCDHLEEVTFGYGGGDSGEGLKPCLSLRRIIISHKGEGQRSLESQRELASVICPRLLPNLKTIVWVTPDHFTEHYTIDHADHGPRMLLDFPTVKWLSDLGRAGVELQIV